MSKERKIAVFGFSVECFEALKKAGIKFMGVVPPEFKQFMEQHDLEYFSWKFDRINEESHTLCSELANRNVTTAMPLYEETVEWAGYVNSFLRDDPRLFNRYYLFRNKAMMKRKAQMAGIRVGVFEEAENQKDVEKFFNRVNEALLKLKGEVDFPVHMKPLDAAGCRGHRMIGSLSDIKDIEEEEFPSLLESHLDGQEFSCEVFIHNKKIQFLNITEYVKLGHSNFIPCGSKLEQKRPIIRKAVEELIEAFGIEYGLIHPEWFLTSDDKLNFGEVAARVPGGHMFELMERVYGFNPFTGFALCCDPNTTQEELDAFFPDEKDHKGYAGCLMVYPKQQVVRDVNLPEGLLEDPYYERHNLFTPATTKVAERVAFGDHYGTVFFHGDSDEGMHERLELYETKDFYN